MSQKAILEYFGHSCFRIALNQYRIVLDPYADDSVPGLKLPDDLEAEEVLISHSHEDHNAVHKVKVNRHFGKSPFAVSSLEVPHDDCGGEKRGMNQIHILEGDGFKIAHFGDLGRMLNVDEISRLQNCSVIMIPCGGYFTIDAAQAYTIIQKLNPHLSVLMHYRTDSSGYGLLENIQSIRKQIPELKVLDQSVLTLDENGPVGIVAMKAEQKTGK